MVHEMIGRDTLAAARVAESNREALHRAGVFTIGISGAPGSGKTSLVAATLERLGSDVRTAVVVGNLAAERDANRFRSRANQLVEIRTAELDATHVRNALANIDLAAADLLLIESIGAFNGALPADLGQDVRVAIFSVSGGDDKAAEFPLSVANTDLLLLNKLDLLPHVEFDLDVFRSDCKRLNPTVPILMVSASRGIGMNDWERWLCESIHRRRPPVDESRSRKQEWYLG